MSDNARSEYNESLITIIVCDCHPDGSKDTNCDRATGKCDCRKRITGRACDQCTNGYYGLSDNGKCTKCSCNKAGTLDGESEDCDKVLNQCYINSLMIFKYLFN